MCQVCPRGRSALHYASEYGGVATLRVLVANGAGVNLCDNAGNTALHLTRDAAAAGVYV